jgi:nucleotide-binding universal stress UspA family protein
MRALIAVDFGLYGKAQTEFIQKFCGAKELTLKVLHVMEPLCWELQTGYVTTMPLSDSIIVERRAAAEQLVRTVAASLEGVGALKGIDAEIREGNVASEILAAADDFAADLLIVGSHGKTGMQRFLLGSVSQAVSAHAKCTVVIARRTD